MIKPIGAGLKGGFYPSIMAGVSTTGPYFLTAAVAQGIRLVRNNRTKAGRRSSRRRNKRSKRSRKTRHTGK